MLLLERHFHHDRVHWTLRVSFMNFLHGIALTALMVVNELRDFYQLI